ncbi:unnamed protein product [Ectocarpus sp. 4 AP-2014]
MDVILGKYSLKHSQVLHWCAAKGGRHHSRPQIPLADGNLRRGRGGGPLSCDHRRPRRLLNGIR